MGKSMSLLKPETASDKQQDQVNNNQEQVNSNHNQQCEASSNKEHDQATINNLSRAHYNNPNPTAQNRAPNTINMPPQATQQEGAATPQGSNTTEKDSQKMCCKNRLNRMQCAFLITGIILLVAGCITLGIMLGKNWLKNSVTARTQPVYKEHFVTATGKHIATYKVIVDQTILLKGNTEDTFLVTTLKQPTSVGRALEQSDTPTIPDDNIPAFVTLTEGAVTARAANSDDITLLVNVDELNKQSNGAGAGRFLQGSDSKEQLFEQIKKDVAEKAEVDLSQVSIIEETYIKLAADQKGELVAEEIQPRRNLDEAKVVAKSAQTTEKKNYVKGALVALSSIGKFFVDAKDKLKRYEQKIAAQTKCGFRSTNDYRVSIEVTKKIGNNHLQIRREYEEILNRRPKQIKNTIVIPVEEYEAFKHCFDHKDGKYCAKRFINRVDNPFKLSNQSRDRSNLHQQHLFLIITINDRRSSQNKKEHEQHNHAVEPSHKAKNLNKEDKQTEPVKPAEKKAEEKPAADTQKTNTTDTKKQEQSSKVDSNQVKTESKGGSSSASSNQKV